MPKHRTHAAAVLLLALVLPPASAMDEREAASNLMFFVAAMNEGAFCESLGFKSMVKLRAWETKNQAFLIRSMKTIQDYAVASGKVSKEDATSASLGLWARLQQRDAKELAPTRTAKTCARFEESLAFYETKFVQ